MRLSPGPDIRAAARPRAERPRADDFQGLAHLLLVAAVAAGGVWLSLGRGWAAWLLGQVLVAAAFVQCFCVLHECGHRTFFRTRPWNLLVGHLTAALALIPFTAWRRVHALHHRWTGWQDLDPTTASLVPRKLGRLERKLANFCWHWWIPLFSVLYRVTNYWNLPRLSRLLGRAATRRITFEVLVLGLLYGLATWWLGPLTILRAVGLGLVLGLVFQDVFLLGQHTHIPQHLSRGGEVRRFAASEQGPYTRSVLFPRWFSRLVLLGADAHGLHHLFPGIPGQHLRGLGITTPNEVSWWSWTLAARRVPAEVFLFANRDRTGLAL